MLRIRTLALVAGIAVFAALAPAEAQRAPAAPAGAPLSGEALRQRISGRALIAANGVRINLYADGRITVWAGGRLSTDGTWRMCGPTRICAQAQRSGQIELAVYPNGTGTMGGSNGSAITIGTIDRSRDSRPRP